MSESENYENECPICFSKMMYYLYSNSCYDNWIRENKNTCPFCRKKIRNDLHRGLRNRIFRPVYGRMQRHVSSDLDLFGIPFLDDQGDDQDGEHNDDDDDDNDNDNYYLPLRGLADYYRRPMDLNSLFPHYGNRINRVNRIDRINRIDQDQDNYRRRQERYTLPPHLQTYAQTLSSDIQNLQFTMSQQEWIQFVRDNKAESDRVNNNNNGYNNYSNNRHLPEPPPPPPPPPQPSAPTSPPLEFNPSNYELPSPYVDRSYLPVQPPEVKPSEEQKSKRDKRRKIIQSSSSSSSSSSSDSDESDSDDEKRKRYRTGFKYGRRRNRKTNLRIIKKKSSHQQNSHNNNNDENKIPFTFTVHSANDIKSPFSFAEPPVYQQQPPPPPLFMNTQPQPSTVNERPSNKFIELSKSIRLNNLSSQLQNSSFTAPQFPSFPKIEPLIPLTQSSNPPPPPPPFFIPPVQPQQIQPQLIQQQHPQTLCVLNEANHVYNGDDQHVAQPFKLIAQHLKENEKENCYYFNNNN